MTRSIKRTVTMTDPRTGADMTIDVIIRVDYDRLAQQEAYRVHLSPKRRAYHINRCVQIITS